MKRKRILYFCLILFIFTGSNTFLNPNLHAQSPSFPMNHWVYSFLDRMQAKGVLNNFLPDTKPYTRNQIAEAIFPLFQDSDLHSKLNATELDQLNFLKLEFKEELADKNIDTEDVQAERLVYLRRNTFLKHLLPNFVLQNKRNLLFITTDHLYLAGDFIFYYDTNSRNFSFKNDQTIRLEKHGITLWGAVGKYVQFYFDFRDATEWGGSYPVNQSVWSFDRVGYANAKGDHVFFDETTTGIFAGHGFFQIMIGKEKNRWGPGQFGALALSDWATSYDQVKLQLNWNRIRFTAFTGFLRSYPPVIEFSYDTGQLLRQVRANKYLAAHRLEFMPFKQLIIGLHETLVYGERNLELAYINPINFYWSAEHYLGDQDNSAIGMDFSLYPGWKLKFYGELFLDDLQTGNLGSDWYGNKWAGLIGISVFDVMKISNLDFHAELTKVRPYVYTHKFPINIYKQFTSPLGYWSGPNTQVADLALDYRLSKHTVLQLKYENYKHGANPADGNVGGNIDFAHRPIDKEQQPFLDGELERYSGFRLNASYEVLRNAYLNVELSDFHYSNFFNDDNQRVDGTEKSWRLVFSWNY